MENKINMKREIIFVLSLILGLACFNFKACAQAGSLDGKALHLDLTDSSLIITPTGKGTLYYNHQSQKWIIYQNGIRYDLKKFASGGLTGALSTAHIFVGNVSNIATDVALSGDGTLSSSGSLSVTKILGNTIPVNASGVLTNNGSGTLSWAAVSTTLASLTDANISSPTNNQFLRYNTSDNKWHNDSFLAGTDYQTPLVAGTNYEVPLIFSTGLTRSTNTITVNTSQNITTLSNLTTKGLVTTTAAGLLGSTQGTGFIKDNGTGTISYDASTYITGNQTITLSGHVSGSGATSITTTIGAGVVTNSMLAGGITDANLATSYLKADGTRALTADWGAGTFSITGIKSFAISGTAGDGYGEFIAQSSNSSAPSGTGFRLFAGSTGNFRWAKKNGSDTFVRGLTSTLTADRDYTLPDWTGNILVDNGNNTFSGSTTLTSNTAGWLNFSSTFTATANNQFAVNWGGTITARATIADQVIADSYARTLATATTGQTLTAMLINPTFNETAALATNKYLIRVQAAGVDEFTIKDNGSATFGTTMALSTSATTFGTVSAANLNLQYNNSTKVIISSNGTKFQNNPSNTSNAWIEFAQSAMSSGSSSPGILFTGGAHTGLNASTEVNSVNFNLGQTKTWQTGTPAAIQREFRLQAPTYGIATTNTFPDVSFLDLDGAISGQSAAQSSTLTVSSALRIRSKSLTNVTTSYGALINAQTGGTTNYALGLTGNMIMTAAGNKIFITEGTDGSVGQTTLVAGTKAVTVNGTTTSSRCLLTLVTPTGTTLTTTYQCACTSNTVTIQANVAVGTINTADTSVLNYWIVN